MLEETEDWRKVHNEELHDLCSSPNVIRKRWQWIVAIEVENKCIHGFSWET
jgi:hypothetical protein